MLIRFWGTRGSIPTPGRGTTLYGGNTSCVEVRADDGTVILLDCGTGARPLGLDLLSRGPTVPPMHILVTHTHWDHIQGFPFFLPAYVAGTRLSVYGARGLDRTLEGSLSGQMQHTYFPVQLDELRADIAFEEVSEERFRVGPFRVTSQLINHTTATVAYRLTAGQTSIAYVTDHEPFWWDRPKGRSAHRFVHPGEERHVSFVEGVDVLIHDAQYSDTEYPAKRGWGHSTIEYAVDLAVRAGAKRLVLFHHDPTHSDAWIRHQLSRARRRAEAQKSTVEILAAAEGDQIELTMSAGEPVGGDDGVLQTPTGRILVVGSDRGAIDEVREALAPDGYHLMTADQHELEGAGARGRIDLLILVGPASEATLLGQAASIREHAWGAKLPVLVLATTEGPGAAGRLVDGITDVLSRPFNSSMLRPRVRAWLARTGTLVERRMDRRPRIIGAAGSSVRGLLRGLPMSQRAALMSGAVVCRFRRGDVLFNEGDPAGGMYFIREGRVEMSLRTSSGEHVLGAATIGDTVGELAALDGGPRTATARAVEPTVADYLPRDMLEPSLAAAPSAAFRLMRLMAERLRKTDRLVGELMTHEAAAE